MGYFQFYWEKNKYGVFSALWPENYGVSPVLLPQKNGAGDVKTKPKVGISKMLKSGSEILKTWSIFLRPVDEYMYWSASIDFQ